MNSNTCKLCCKVTRNEISSNQKPRIRFSPLGHPWWFSSVLELCKLSSFFCLRVEWEPWGPQRLEQDLLTRKFSEHNHSVTQTQCLNTGVLRASSGCWTSEHCLSPSCPYSNLVHSRQQASQASYATFIKARPVAISCYCSMVLLPSSKLTFLFSTISWFCATLLISLFYYMMDLVLVLQIGLFNSLSLPLLIKKKVYEFLKVNFFHTCDVLVVVRALGWHGYYQLTVSRTYEPGFWHQIFLNRKGFCWHWHRKHVQIHHAICGHWSGL